MNATCARCATSAHASDPADVDGPWHGLLGATVHGLLALLRRGAVSPQAALIDDVAAVRALAERVRTTDPSFARDLWAIAARHEAEIPAEIA